MKDWLIGDGGKMTCCYLCKSSFECRLKRGGLFVPLQEHFEHYCLKDNFINCKHFIQSATDCDVLFPFSSSPIGGLRSSLPHRERRYFARQMAAFPVTLSSCDSEWASQVDSDTNTLAHTVDLAQGGMRVRATSQIAQQGLLLFNFGEGFIAPLIHGLAEVCWQRMQLDKGQWEAGLSFKDEFVKAVIAVQMSS